MSVHSKIILLFGFIFLANLSSAKLEIISNGKINNKLVNEDSKKINSSSHVDTKEVNSVFNEDSKKINSSSHVDTKENREPSSNRSAKKLDVKRSNIFIPKAKDDKTFKAKRKIPLKEIRPPSDSRLYYNQGTDEAELESTINEEIKYLYKLIKKQPKPEFLLRLGSIYVDKARLITLNLQVDFEKKMQAYEQGARKTKPILNFKSAAVYNKKALKLFNSIQKKYPKHKRMDEILFFLGFNSYQIGLEDVGAKYFKELESQFSKSEYLYEVWFQLGEHYFKKRNWTNSFIYYKKVSKNKNGKFYFFALYKMAWSHYKRGQATKGLKLLEKIIVEGDKENNKLQKRFTFTAEATQDVVLFYTYSRRSPKLAKRYFLGFLEDEVTWRSLKNLAYAYRDTGNFQGVQALFQDLINHQPLDKQGFDYKYQIVNATYSSGTISEIIQQFQEWIENYGASSRWAIANARDKKLIQKSNKLIEATLRNYALKNHQTFRISKNKREYTIAVNLYRLYLSKFKKSSFSDQVLFFYGEFLFDSKQYQKAVQAYEIVIKTHPNSKYAKPAYTNQLLAAEKQTPNAKKIKALIGKSTGFITFPEALKTFNKVAIRHLKKFPNDKNSSTLLYRVSFYLYKFNQFEPAAKQLNNLIQKYPNSNLISSAGSLLLDIYNKTKNHQELEKLAKFFSNNRKIDKELADEAHFILEQISFKKAQDFAIDKKYKESAELYNRFAIKNPRSDLIAVSFYNAAVNYEKAKELKKALAMYSSVLTHKSKSKNNVYKKSVEFLPILQEKLGFYKKAADGYAFYANKYPKSSKAADYWYNSGVIFDALNMVKSAVFSYEKYYSLSSSQERYDVLYSIATLHKRFSRWNEAIAYYERYLRSNSSNKFQLVKASYELATIYQKSLKNKQKASLWHTKTLSLFKRLNAGIFYGASSHFYITYKIYNQFVNVKIPKQTSKQKAAIGKKIKLLKHLESNLKPIIRYNDGENIIAALALIGLANQKMAEAIYKTPLPKNLNKAGLQQYKLGIKNLMKPYIQKAINSYQLALEKSQSFQVYSDWIKEIQKGLGFINAKSFEEFKTFNYNYVEPEVLKLTVLDNKEIITKSLLSKAVVRLKNGVTEEELIAVEKAIKSKLESRSLNAISNILSKDSDNILALNTLALFYIKNKKTKLGALIINRMHSKNKKNPMLLNNLGIIALKYGDKRLATQFFKDALAAKSSYAIAKVNLANLFMENHDYTNAYPLYKASYNKVFNKKSKENERFLNNYGVSLMSAKKWKTSLNLFKGLSSQPSPKSSVLFNYALVLVKGFKSKRFKEEARELISELYLYSKSAMFKKKLDKLLKSTEVIKK